MPRQSRSGRKGTRVLRQHGEVLSRINDSVELEAGRVCILLEITDERKVIAQEVFDERCRLVAAAQPDHLRRRAVQSRDVREICIQSDDGIALLARERPDRRIRRAIKTGLPHLFASGKNVRQRAAKTVTQVLIEQELHAGAVTMRRSRSAA